MKCFAAGDKDKCSGPAVWRWLLNERVTVVCCHKHAILAQNRGEVGRSLKEHVG